MLCVSRCDEGALAVGELVSRTDKDSSQVHENLSGEIAVAIRKPLCGNGHRIEYTAGSISFLQRGRTEKGGFAASAFNEG